MFIDLGLGSLIVPQFSLLYFVHIILGISVAGGAPDGEWQTNEWRPGTLCADFWWWKTTGRTLAKQRSTHFRASLLGPPGLGMNNYVLNLEGFFMCENSIRGDFKSTLCNSTEKDELYVSEMIVMLAICVYIFCSSNHAL